VHLAGSSGDSEAVPLIWRSTRTVSAAVVAAADYAMVLIVLLGGLLVL
jgi:hypothetical protein